jgi:hypothetical protein
MKKQLALIGFFLSTGRYGCATNLLQISYSIESYEIGTMKGLFIGCALTNIDGLPYSTDWK